MTFRINDIISNLQYGGARPTLFQVQFNNPANNSAFIKTPFLVQAAHLPSVDKGIIEVPYFGRRIKLAGDRVYPSWTVSVINDEDFLIRNALEEWSNRINGFENNLRTLRSYKSEATITQFAKDGSKLRTYSFHGIFPSNVSPISMNWAETDSYESFEVEFQYDYWTVDGATGDAGGY